MDALFAAIKATRVSANATPLPVGRFIKPSGVPPMEQPMYACPHCNSTHMFMAFKDGLLIKVLEDHEDVEGLDSVGELLCVDCNQWFANPTLGEGAHRELTGELVTITGLKGKGTIKVVATGRTFPFHYDTYEDEVARLLQREDPQFVTDLLEFVDVADHQLGLRVKEQGNPNTWVYRINQRRLIRQLRH